LSGKSNLTKLGKSTLHTEIARPIIAVPKNNPILPVTERIVIPIVKKIIDENMVSLVPYLLAKFGANGENKANANNGNVVIIPANVFEIPRSSLIYDNNGPTEVIGARRLAAISTTPKINAKEADFVFILLTKFLVVLLLNSFILTLLQRHV